MILTSLISKRRSSDSMRTKVHNSSNAIKCKDLPYFSAVTPTSYSVTVATFPSAVPGLWIFPNSSPPLMPLFLPPIWNLPDIPPPVAPAPLEPPLILLLLSPPSPNLEKKPRFLTSFLSSRPTSSNPSSASAVAGCRSKCRDSIAERGKRGRRALSRDWRVLISVAMGERAEIS